MTATSLRSSCESRGCCHPVCLKPIYLSVNPTCPPTLHIPNHAFLPVINKSKIRQALSNLDGSKHPGRDGIPFFVLNTCAQESALYYADFTPLSTEIPSFFHGRKQVFSLSQNTEILLTLATIVRRTILSCVRKLLKMPSPTS